MRDIDTLLREADPAAGTPAYAEGERARLLASVVETPMLRRSAGWRIAAVAAAAALVTALGVTNLQGGALSARADEVLTQAAINAADPAARGDQWWRITTEGRYLHITPDATGDAYCMATTRRVEWVAVDGTRPTVFQDAPVELAPIDPARPCTTGRTSTETWSYDRAPVEMAASWQSPTPQFLAGAPREVDALRDRLYADSKGHGRDPDSEVFVYVADALRSGLVPADLRAAMFEVLKTVPGIEVTSDEVVDGRSVVGLEIKDVHGQAERLLIDPAGGVVVGERFFIPQIGADGGSRVARELVDEVPAEVVSAVRINQAGEVCQVQGDGSFLCEG